MHEHTTMILFYLDYAKNYSTEHFQVLNALQQKARCIISIIDVKNFWQKKIRFRRIPPKVQDTKKLKTI